ncbi:WYL domain-containing protein [Stenotrophomonas maltophilia]|uniref:WYL domain-containing protein n=1 Tax=Stenotrophomonas maltophilia TaxID=40324 RepID=UPI000DA9B509|nr:WYL domain-containing protein [Stenotrophomonas maltophilia]PZS55047.1 WYL domain-containing protein [Stenotrophomonas maltophilia]
MPFKVNKLDDNTPRKERWGQARRLEFIDSRLLWTGKVNRSDLVEFFKISPPQATLDFAEYAGRAPQNAKYDARERAYVAMPTYSPVFAEPSSARYLAELHAVTTGLLSTDLSFLSSPPPAEVVSFPSRQVNVVLLRETLAAIQSNRAMEITYQTMARADADVRAMSPLALAYDGFRWHIRAYCHLREDYRDFIFARILLAKPSGPAQATIADDKEWNHFIDVEIAPNPLLSEGARRVIELDYGMSDGKLKLKCRQAMGYYLLARLGLKEQENENARSQQIVLANRAELSVYLPTIVRPDR